MTVFMETISMYVETCCNCGVLFAMPIEMSNQLRRNGYWFYCPNGHQQRYSETEESRLKKKLAEANQRLANAEFEIIAAEKRVKRLEKRVKNGVCPCCHRQFVQLARHMKTQHPEFAEEQS